VAVVGAVPVNLTPAGQAGRSVVGAGALAAAPCSDTAGRKDYVGHSYSLPTIKILFGTARHCAYPGCTVPLVFEDRGCRTVAVQIAHIRSAQPGGPRHDPGYDIAKLNTDENLLLLCTGPHHDHVDKHEHAYPVEELLEWKKRQVAQGQGCEVADDEIEPLAQKLDEFIVAVQKLERSAQRALESAPAIPLAQDLLTMGEGIYALYYSGSYDLYKAISSTECSVPLYVGTVASNHRGAGSVDAPRNNELRRTLKHHRQTIGHCQNLRVSDFLVRCLQMDGHRVKGIELLMLAAHRPVWNTILPGLGFHAPGTTRPRQERSPWDELHPGRPWAAKLAPCSRSVEELQATVLRHFTEFAVPRKIRQDRLQAR
jgi:hypothetical protein